jgi:O-antigen ligase
MKKLFSIKDTLENKISYFLIACFLVALPFDHFYSEWLLIILSLHTFIHIKKDRLIDLKNKKVWIVASLFFLSIAGIAYSNYKAEGLQDSFQQMGILLFPVLLSLTNLNLKKYKLFLLEIFGLTCTITILYLYFDAFRVIRYFHLSWSSLFSNYFINQNFSAPIGIHATYLSMYATISISIFLFLFFQNPKLKNAKYIIYSAILLAGLIQLSSRSVLIGMEIIIVVLVPAFLLQGKKKFSFFIISLIISLLAFLIVTQVASFKKRNINDLENDLSEYTNPGDHLESRMLRWGLEWELIKKSPLVGYGTGSEKYILNEKYFENKFFRSYLAELNSHNQYLSFIINTGAIGLLLYFYVLYYGFVLAVRKKNFLLMSFITIVAVVSVSENILDVSKGVLFYAFLYSFLLEGISHEQSAHETNMHLKRQPEIILKRFVAKEPLL